MKKLLFILIFLPIIGFGQIHDFINIEIENKLDTSSILFEQIDSTFQEIVSKSFTTILPYPIIFIHGLNGNGNSWKDICTFYNSHCNWTYGGELEFCLEMYDNPGVRQDLCKIPDDIYSFIPGNLTAADYYRIEFDCNSFGSCHTSGFANQSLFNSNQAGIVKQGYALGIAIDKVLIATGKDKVILVGHSMGGLAAREYIQNSSHWLTSNHRVAKLITSGTPHKGSNFSGFGTGIFINSDERSEAVRDLRQTYFYSNDNGVYLFGGLEYQNGSTHMDDNINFYNQDFRNVDVNCNDNTLENITGLNYKPISTNVDYACIYGTDDNVVPSSSSNLKDVYTFLNRLELMTCNNCNHSSTIPNIVALTDNDVEPLYRTFKSLDEPDYLDLAYKIELGKWYNGYLTFQDVNHPNPNIDDDAYYFYNILSNDILINFTNLPANSMLNVYNSNSSSAIPIDFTYSNSFNGGTAVLLLNNLPSGYYYIKLSASPYNFPNTGIPTAWDNPYFFNISNSTASLDDITISKDLIKITDILGRESKELKNQPLFYIYDDGTVEKRITID